MGQDTAGVTITEAESSLFGVFEGQGNQLIQTGLHRLRKLLGRVLMRPREVPVHP